MKRILWLCIIGMYSLAGAAQKARVYKFTPASRKFLSDSETDSLLHVYAGALFQQAQIPAALFEKKYTAIQGLLIAGIQPEVTAAYSNLEKKQKKALSTPPGTAAYDSVKQLYRQALRTSVQRVFAKTPALKQYLNFNGSDRINWFGSNVQVLPDGKLKVTETIRIFNGDGRVPSVYSNDKALLPAATLNNEIKRGIVRAFPLYYINRYKLFQNTTFEVKQVLKNGKPEDYHQEKKDNGVLLYIGNRNVQLATGTHTYTIVYETAHQLKLLRDFDELSWNVTGNGWSFRIDSAACTVVLPKGAALLSGACYTGLQGSRENECTMQSSQAGDSVRVTFTTNRALMPWNGITVAVAWPKGFVTAPGTWSRLKYFFWNNKAVFLLPLAALISAIFCFIFWWRYGRDPEKGTIYVQFEPPAGYSPAAIGYIYYQKYKRNLTAATLVDAAVRNIIRIDVEREGKIFKHNEYHILPPAEKGKKKAAGYEDFEDDIVDLRGTSIRKGKYNSELGDLNSRIQEYCRKNYKNKDGGFKKGYYGFFATNGSYTAIPILLCILAGGWAFFEMIKAVVHKNYWQVAYFIGGIWLCSIVLSFFARLLTAYSPDGRKLMDKIEGFRLFLSTADEQRLDMLNPPDKTPELYEKYLPFAIALGCEIAWGKKFEAIINTAYLDGNATSSFSQSLSRDSEQFSSSFSSAFSGAITSASTPPSSSSDGGSSFGGGSSGGGGGGGGGGGW